MLPRDVGIPGWEVHPGELSCESLRLDPRVFTKHKRRAYSNKRGLFIFYTNYIFSANDDPYSFKEAYIIH